MPGDKVSFTQLKVGDVIYDKTNFSVEFVKALGGGQSSRSRDIKRAKHFILVTHKSSSAPWTVTGVSQSTSVEPSRLSTSEERKMLTPASSYLTQPNQGYFISQFVQLTATDPNAAQVSSGS